MKFHKLPLPGACLIEREERRDERGFFARTFCHRELAEHGLDFEIRQCNMSMSLHKGTLRGLHFQRPPHQEIKLVSCLRGKVFDCIVDLRKDSPTYLRHCGVILEAFGPAIFVPAGFAHGIQTLEDETIIEYRVSADYAPDAEGGVRWNDPRIGIQWPECQTRIISEKDGKLPFLLDADISW